MSLVELRGRVRRARAMNLAELAPGVVYERVRRLMDGYATKTIVIGTNGVFRARVNPDPGGQFNNSSELWYPPQTAVAVAGRFNRPGQVKCYVSNRPHAAVLEAQAKVGDRVTLLVAASKRPAAHLTCTHIGLHRCKEDVDIVGPGGGMNLQNDLKFQADLREMRIGRQWRLLDDYFTDLATAVPPPGTEQDHYKATNAIAEVLGGINDHRALLYPCVATNLRSFNLAISPAMADELFFPFEAWQFEVLGHYNSLPRAPESASGYLRIETSARSEVIDEEGNIHWKVASPDELIELHGALGRAHLARKRLAKAGFQPQEGSK